MITVADIIALPGFGHIELAAPCEDALKREVRNVGILDCPPDYNDYRVYKPGELILTNLGFAYGDPNLAEKSLLAMLRRDVAGIAVKTVYNGPISNLVREESMVRGVPLYVYDGAYHEKIAFQSLALIERDRNESDKAKTIDQVLCTHDSDWVRMKLSAFAGMTGLELQCFAFSMLTDDACSFYAVLDSVGEAWALIKESYQVMNTFHVCRYHDYLLGFVSYGLGDEDEKMQVEKRCATLAVAAGNLHCGVGELVALSDGDLSIHQALTAVNRAKALGECTVSWSDLKVFAFEDAARSSLLFMRASDLYRSMLTRYDEEHGSELFNTALALVRWYGDVKIVADKVHQHPNTIRYRMRKIKSLFGISDQDNKSLLYLLNVIFLPVLHFSSKPLLS